MNREEAEKFAKENGLILEWGQSIQVGNLYLAKKNTGWHLLTCRSLGEGFVNAMPEGNVIPYSYDLCDCVKVSN